jgi:hypothetical protein
VAFGCDTDWLLFPGHYQRLTLLASLTAQLRADNSGLLRLFGGLRCALGGPQKVSTAVLDFRPPSGGEDACLTWHTDRDFKHDAWEQEDPLTRGPEPERRQRAIVSWGSKEAGKTTAVEMPAGARIIGDSGVWDLSHRPGPAWREEQCADMGQFEGLTAP